MGSATFVSDLPISPKLTAWKPWLYKGFKLFLLMVMSPPRSNILIGSRAYRPEPCVFLIIVFEPTDRRRSVVSGCDFFVVVLVEFHSGR